MFFSFLFLTISSSISCQAVSSTRRSAWGKFYLFIGPLIKSVKLGNIHVTELVHTQKDHLLRNLLLKSEPTSREAHSRFEATWRCKVGGLAKGFASMNVWLNNVLKIFPINAILTKKYGLLNIIVCADQHLEEKSTGSVCSTRGLLGAPGSREGCNPLGLKI